VYATLPLIVCGVVLASVKDFSFSFNSLSFGAGHLSLLFYKCIDCCMNAAPGKQVVLPLVVL